MELKKGEVYVVVAGIGGRGVCVGPGAKVIYIGDSLRNYYGLVFMTQNGERFEVHAHKLGYYIGPLPGVENEEG